MPKVSCIATLALAIGVISPLNGSGNVLPPGQFKEQWRRKFDSLNEFYITQDPRAVEDPRFFVELAKSAYHCDELEVGVAALQSAAILDPSQASEWVGMECDLHFYRSRLDGTALSDVAQCLNRQMELDLNGKTTTSNPSFWESYSRILLDLGRYDHGIEALERSLQASAAVDEGGQVGVPHPRRWWLLGKAYLTADEPLKALDVLEPHLGVWRFALQHSELGDLADELPDQVSSNATAARAEHAIMGLSSSLSLDWVASAWHDASLAHLKLGQVSEALWRCQVALQLEPDHASPHAENYHQTLARIYVLELGRLDLARAALWGLAGLNRNSVPASGFLRRGFDEAADHFKRTRQGHDDSWYGLNSSNGMRHSIEGSLGSNHAPPDSSIECHEVVDSINKQMYPCQISPEDEVRLHQLALLSADDPAYYFTMAVLSPCARNTATDQCFWTEHIRLPESDPNWGHQEPCFNCMPDIDSKDAADSSELGVTSVHAKRIDGLGRSDWNSDHETYDHETDTVMANNERYEYRDGGVILADVLEAASPTNITRTAAAAKVVPAAVPKAAIVYLCCADEREAFDLGTSLALLRNAMGNRWRRRYPVSDGLPNLLSFYYFFSRLVVASCTTSLPSSFLYKQPDRPMRCSFSKITIAVPLQVLILHDFLVARHMDALYARVGSDLGKNTSKSKEGLDLRFHWLAPHDWQGKLPDDASSLHFNATNKLFGYGMGYRHMCRFFSGPPLADLPVLKDFNFVLRLDTDSFLLGPLQGDPLQALSQGQVRWCSCGRVQ